MDQDKQKNFSINHSDIIVAAVLMMILTVLVIPVPTQVLDVMLVLSLGTGILVLVMTTQLRDALSFSSFPSLLLVLTLFRLSLNVATTRQILMRGWAGNVIQAFGDFVVGGNYIVGIVVFLILVTINFMVITKGSGRIAEVAARFTLDAMPGKQMSIDADLNAGLIDEKQALERREKLTREADFYGAMDGAGKFVRGDAIAGLIITIINICGGFAVGMIQQDMSAGESIKTYTVLTVGDGLVAQIPALVISTAAGMIVTRAASDNSVGVDVGRQLFFKPKPLMITGGILSFVGFVPGMPFVPFLALGATMGGFGYSLKTGAVKGAEEEEGDQPRIDKGQEPKALPSSSAVASAPVVSPMDLEIGFGLVPLVDQDQGGKLVERVGMVRSQIAEEIGFVLPPVNIKDNVQLQNSEYCIKVRGLEMARGSVRPDLLLAISPGGEVKLEGYSETREPAFGFKAYWIPKNKKEFAEARGMTVVDCASVITTHLAEVAKEHASKLISRQDVSDMIDNLKENHPSVVQELIPNKMTVGGVHRVLQGLLREKVPIRDFALILETISDQVGRTQDTGILVEYCRQALGGHICREYKRNDGSLPAIGIHPDLETLVKNSTHRDGAEIGSLVMNPDVAEQVINEVQTTLEAARKAGEQPVLLCSPLIRPQFRHLIEHRVKEVPVISFAEVPDSLRLDMIGMVKAPEIKGEAEPVGALAGENQSKE